MSKEAIQRGVYAALGHVKLDYRSPKRLDEAAGIVADFVLAEIEKEGVLVPREATTAQLAAGQRAWIDDPLKRSSTLYRAMVEASHLQQNTTQEKT